MQSMELYQKMAMDNLEFPAYVFIDDFEKEGQYFLLHWHEHLELHYVLEGNPVFHIGQQEEQLQTKPGDLVIVNSNKLHVGFCNGKRVRVLVTIFDLADFSKELKGQDFVFQSLVRGDATVGEFMDTLWVECCTEQIGYQLSCKGILIQLVTYLIRNYTTELLDKRESVRRKKQLKRLNTTIKYIGEHYAEPISNGELAELVSLSESRFNHLFKDNMGVSPMQYINEVRLKKAMMLLQRGEITVSEVSAAVGFEDYNYFGRMFRRYFGCTPRQAVGGREENS